MLQAFTWYLPADSQHWNRVRSHADDLTKKGIAAVWLAPAYKGAEGRHDVGYGVYDLYDLGEVDQKGSRATKYGTVEDFLACVQALQAAGMQIIVDVVLNQKMGADAPERVRAVAVDESDRNHRISDWQEIEAWTKFTFEGRSGTYSDFVWDWHCFHGVDYNGLNGDKSIFLFEGKHWDANVNRENGNFDYLMGCDVDLLYPPVYEELVRWGIWFVRRTGARGVRLDAVKHMDRDFYLRWLQDVREAVGYDLFAGGEYWDSNRGALQRYLGAERAMSLFDVTLHFKLHDASISNGMFDLRKIFDGTLTQADPNRAVTFVDNHDTQTGQSLQSPVADWFKLIAYALILLREAGYPCVFYGDLYGTPCVQKIPDLAVLLQVRKYLAYGAQHDRFDNPGVIGWSREGDKLHTHSGCAVVVSNRGATGKRLYVGISHARELWHCVVGGLGPVIIDGDGWAWFGVPSSGLSVYASAQGSACIQEVMYGED
jgi:alpha-amylase